MVTTLRRALTPIRIGHGDYNHASYLAGEMYGFFASGFCFRPLAEFAQCEAFGES
jgi:hypothetical protein